MWLKRNKILSDDLINEFYEVYKNEFTGLSKEDIKKICYTPFKHLKEEMSSDELPEIRLRYFGLFKVHPSRAKHKLRSIKERFKLHKISPKQYFKDKAILEKYLEQYEDKTDNNSDME